MEMSDRATLRKKEAALNIDKEKRAGAKRDMELGEPWGRGEQWVRGEDLIAEKRRRVMERTNSADKGAARRRDES